LPDRAWEERAAAILARRLRPTFEHPVSGAETARLAAEHARAGVAAVVVAGGDGTINRVVNELAGTGVPIGILPRGTANDFAREVDLPLEIAAAAPCAGRRRASHRCHRRERAGLRHRRWPRPAGGPR